MTHEVITTSYKLPITVDCLNDIFEADDRDFGSLASQIENLPGVFDADYNGHFGAFIFYTVEKEYDTPLLHRTITALLAKHVSTGTNCN